MNKTWQRTLQQIGIALPLSFATAIISTAPQHTLAQLIPDNTLGAENSIVTPEALRDLIEGGAIRGDNLFHSFTEFNVNDGQNVFFANPEGILNILTRVTGGNPSSIFGTLGVDGAANLFLLNPNGIIFGENAQLSLTGSFLATTADSFVFADGFEFSASNPQAPPLLTVNIPIGLRFRDNPGDIAVNQSNLTVNQRQNISLVGGNVSVTGSGDITNLQGSLTAPGGRIELGSLTAAGTVNLNPDLSLVFPDGVARGDVSLTEAATLSVVSDTIGSNGGSVALLGQNLFITSDGAILAGIGAGFGGEGITSGDIDLNATGAVTISDSSGGDLIPGALTRDRGVQNRLNEGATGTGGNVNVTADSLSITNGGFISISTFGFGDAGDINVDVAGALIVDGENETSFSRLSNVVFSTAVGDGGDIIINADSVSLSNAGLINTQVFGATFDEDGVQLTPGGVGNGGDIQITTNTFNINSGANINASTSGVGNAGNIIVNAIGNVTIDGEISEGFGNTIFSNVNAGAEGNAGDITINAASFNLINGGQLQTRLEEETEDGTPGGIGNAGNILINVTGDVTIEGRGATGLVSAIFNDVESGAVGNAGNITINGNSIFLSNGLLNNQNVTSGLAGTISLNASNIVSITEGSLVNSSGSLGSVVIGGDDNFIPRDITIDASFLFADNFSVPASEFPDETIDAGNLSIRALDTITISNNSQVDASTYRLGNAGNIVLQTDNGQILLDNSFIRSIVFDGAVGNAGTVEITTGSLDISDSFIGTATFSQGNAGLITITATESVSLIETPVERTTFISTQIADTSTGNGADIIINTPSLSLSDANIFTATSGQGNAGNVLIEAENGTIFLDDSSINTDIEDVDATGSAGNITISASSLELINGARFSSNTAGQGSAGNITINASDTVSFDGVSEGGSFSGIFSRVEETGAGNAGNININTGSLSLTNTGRILTSTLGKGDAGNIDIQATGAVTISGFVVLDDTQYNSGISSSVGTDVIGNGGNINLEAGSLSMDDNAYITTDTSGQGNAGIITLNVSGLTSLDDLSNISSEVNTTGVGNAGGIDITTSSLFLTNGAQISSSTFGQGNAGNIDIQATGAVNISESVVLDDTQRNSGISSSVGTDVMGNGGNINLEAGSLLMDDSAFISASTFGQGDAGIITLNVSDLISLDNLSNISSEVNTTGIGNAGEININSNSLSLNNGAQIRARTFGQGNAGNITLDVTDFISLDEASFISSLVGSTGVGNAGGISIESGSLEISNRSQISSSTLGVGNADDISITTDESITISASSTIRANVEQGGNGIAGNINIETNSLTLLSGGQIGAVVFRTFGDLPGGIGQSGNVTINATDFVNISGVGNTGFSSGITVSTGRGSTAISEQGSGNINITTGDLQLSDGGIISAFTDNTGRAGNVTITANNFEATGGGQIVSTSRNIGDAGDIKLNIRDNLTIEGSDPNFAARIASVVERLVDQTDTLDDVIANQGAASGIFANTTEDSTGNAGSITIDPEQVTIRNGGTISVQSLGEGLGGDILLISDNLTVDNATINAETANTDGGNIILEIADLLLLRNGATISASAGGIGDGGNLTINTDFLVAFPQENSDISANAVDGQGGNVNINATNIFGIEPRDGDSPLSDITASSEFGVSGEVIITQPETDPSQGVIELPERVVDSDEQIAENACQLGAGNQFVATGRGGVPTNPNDAINRDNVRVDLVQPVASSTNNVSIDLNSLPLDEEGKPIVPARGWIFTEDGKVILTAYDPNQIDSQRSRGTQTTCNLH